jgi:peptidoglycan hydrolase-like protein with peptidoglycan-binding domain
VTFSAGSNLGLNEMFIRQIGFVLIIALVPVAAAAAELDPAGVNAADFAALNPDRDIHSEIVKAQILLDRANLSPGEIDGQHSARFEQAISAFAEAYGLPADTGWDRSFWLALTSGVTGPALVDYALTASDLKGPFVQLPAKLEDMQSLKVLGFANVREALAEKFHISERLLAALNPDASFFDVGEKIMVPNVLVPAVSGERKAPAARIDVDKDRQTVKVYSAKNELIAFFPASVGSDDRPSPSGTLKVTLIESDPAYHYNPKYQFKEVEKQRPFDLNPGPQQSARHHLDRAVKAELRHSRHAGAVAGGTGGFAWLRAPHQLGRTASRRHAQQGRAGQLQAARIPCCFQCELSASERFSSEVDTGSREENASKQESRASVLIQSEPKML